MGGRVKTTGRTARSPAETLLAVRGQGSKGEPASVPQRGHERQTERVRLAARYPERHRREKVRPVKPPMDGLRTATRSAQILRMAKYPWAKYPWETPPPLAKHRAASHRALRLHERRVPPRQAQRAAAAAKEETGKTGRPRAMSATPSAGRAAPRPNVLGLVRSILHQREFPTDPLQEIFPRRELLGRVRTGRRLWRA